MRHASLRVAVSLAAGLAAAPFAAAQPVAVFSAETSLVNVAVTSRTLGDGRSTA